MIDFAFVASNSMKIADGGWVPLVLAVIVWGVMAIWHRGTNAVVASLRERAVPLPTVPRRHRGEGVSRACRGPRCS